MTDAPIRLGMVGGGEGAFIGGVHRLAARIDDRYELVAGALSSTPEKSLRSGLALGLDPDRIYDDFAVMARLESEREDGIEAVAIVTPNHLHAMVATAFLHAGIHVICDKPVTNTSADARQLLDLALQKKRIFAVTHNYSAYAMVRQARKMVSDGLLGDIRVVQVEYVQDWLAEPIELDGQKQASWRTDPVLAGSGCIGDIGTHAWQLADFILGLPVSQLCAELSSFVPGRAVDDNASVMLRYEGGARGHLWVSQVAPGNANDLRIRVYGARGGLEWRQENPDELRWSPLGESTQLLKRGGPGAFEEAFRLTRIPGGHPEGYLEAFGNLYSEIAEHLIAARTGRHADSKASFPTIADGLRGVQFVESVKASAAAGGLWVPVSS